MDCCWDDTKTKIVTKAIKFCWDLFNYGINWDLEDRPKIDLKAENSYYFERFSIMYKFMVDL